MTVDAVKPAVMGAIRELLANIIAVVAEHSHGIIAETDVFSLYSRLY
jgi:hypothetical protein